MVINRSGVGWGGVECEGGTKREKKAHETARQRDCERINENDKQAAPSGCFVCSLKVAACRRNAHRHHREDITDTDSDTDTNTDRPVALAQAHEDGVSGRPHNQI